MPERPEAPQVVARRSKLLKEPRQRRLAGHPRNAQQFRHQRIAPQIGDVRQLAGVAEQTVQAGQRLFDGEQTIIGSWQPVRQGGGQLGHEPGRLQPAPEHRAARVRRQPLLRKADGDCFAVGFELKCPGHRLVIRADARRLRCFHLPPINPQSVALFQLHHSGLTGHPWLYPESLRLKGGFWQHEVDLTPKKSGRDKRRVLLR